jgi:hypothetical protein
MKTVTMISMLLGMATSSVHSQGVITFGNRLSGQLFAPIFGPELDWEHFGGDWANAKTGNTSSGIPAGTQVYAGSAVVNFPVSFWAAPGIVTDGHLLTQGDVLSMTGSGALAGYFPTRTVSFANLPSTGVATVQVRVYDPNGLWGFGGNDVNGEVAAVSALFQVNIGDTANGLRSFSVGWLDPITLAPYVPEPGVGCLAAFGLAVLAWRYRSKSL